VVISDPRAWTVLDWVKRGLRRGNRLHSRLHRAFTRDEYRAMIEASKFEILRFEDRDPVGLLIASALDLLHLGRNGTAGAFRACEQLDVGATWLLRQLAPRFHFGLTMAVLARKPIAGGPAESTRQATESSRSEDLT
jgi:hypothetical protein